MIYLPKQINYQIYNKGLNKVIKFCSECNMEINEHECKIISVSPFTVECNSNKIVFTKSGNPDDFPPEFDYVIRTKNKPTPSNFKIGKIECLDWLKHPLIHIPTPDEIVNNWKGKFLYKKEDILSLARSIQNKDLKDEETLRSLIKDVSKLAGKEVSKEKEDKIIEAVRKDKIPNSLNKMNK